MPGSGDEDIQPSRNPADQRQKLVEYWVIYPDVDVIRVYRHSGDRFGRAVELSAEAGDVLTTTLLPSLEIFLADVFAG